VRLVHELIRARRDEIETLCRTLGVHRLDLLVVESSIRNPYFRQRVMATKELLYAA
jgi:hypothetical protein